MASQCVTFFHPATMTTTAPQDRAYTDIRDAVRALCAEFPDAYHREVDSRRAYPEAFVDALTKAGWMAALIPQEYGGSGLGLAEASVIMEEINRCGGNSGACHGQMYNMGTLLRHGSKAQKELYLPQIATGALRLQSMGVTEPTTGTDTTKIKTTAVKKGDRYVVNGQKVWISRIQHSDLMILLARTTPLADVKKKSEGMSIFIVDLRDSIGKGLDVRPIPNMVNHETNELFFENLEIPAENLIGEEGQGFKYILDGLNAERTLIAAECIGDGRWFVDKVSAYVKDRIVFELPESDHQVTLAELRESIHVIRELANSRSVEYNGAQLQLPWSKGSHVDVWVAAYGPLALKLTGEVGDGFILQLADLDIAKWMIQTVRDAADNEHVEGGLLAEGFGGARSGAEQDVALAGDELQRCR